MSKENNYHFIEGLHKIADRYKVILCDIWGVIHNGRSMVDSAAEALVSFRATGKKVALITNSPSTGTDVVSHLETKFSFPRDAWDTIVTAGDLAIDLFRERAPVKVFFVGPDEYPGLDLGLQQVDPESAELIILTGLHENLENPDDHLPLLKTFVEKDLLAICVNPDLVVQNGTRLCYCAGAIAKLYEELGGRAVYTGKPHRPIYIEALRRLDFSQDYKSILAIGDGLNTDALGAKNMGIDFLLILKGIHTEQFNKKDDISDLIKAAGIEKAMMMRALAW